MVDHIFNDISHLVQQSHVPERSDGLNRPLTETDFLTYKVRCESNLITINNNLNEKLSEESIDTSEANLTHQFNKDHEFTVVHLLILCGEHSALDSWSTNLTVRTATYITKCMLQLFRKNCVSELLLASDHFIFKNALLQLRPKLLSSTWKCNPAAVLSYYWLLMHVKAPYLNHHLKDVLPTALIITDDFEASNRIKGMQCISHIINNVTKTDLQMYSYSDVILEGLRPILYQNEPDVLEPLLNCLLTLMRKINVQLQCNITDLTKNKFDDVFEVILNNLVLEERNICKSIYLKYLPDMIFIFRLKTLRHSRQLFDMMIRELNFEAPDRNKALVLDVFDSTVKFCWPRPLEVTHPVILAILKIIHDLSRLEENCEPPYTGLVVRIRTSFQLLSNININYKEQIRNVVEKNEHLEYKFKALLDFVLS